MTALTGTDIVSRLNLIFDDAANAKFSAAMKLEAVNAAIDGAWPAVWTVGIDQSITLSSTTYTYTPTALPEFGFNLAYVNYPSLPDTLLRRVFQRQTASGTWEILVPLDLAMQYTSRTLKLWYTSRCARLATVGAALDTALPLDYLWKAAAATLAMIAITKGASFEVAPYEKIAPLYQAQAQLALKAAGSHLKPMPNMIHTSDAVAFYDPGLNKYGPWLVLP